MFKRILTLAAGVALGAALVESWPRVAAAWNFWPDRGLSRASSRVREVMRLVHEHHVDPGAAAYDRLAREALHGMVESLDAHSEFLEKDSRAGFEEDLSGEFGGVGIQVETRQNRIIVIAPTAGGPGERAGIQRGDEILSIDGRAAEAGGLDNVVSRLRGAPGTRVEVRLLRPATRANLSVTVTREVIRVESVRGARLIGDGVGYLQVTEFTDHTGTQFRRALEDLLTQGANSLVLDLRNNPGGVLEAAVEVAEVFFRKGELVVYTQGRSARDREDLRATTEGAPVSRPMAVLVNSGSASAAEIVAGALKDTGRAVVVGERTFGKGSVQTIFPLDGGEGVRLTTAHYFTPGGETIHERGVTPHVEVVMTPEEDARLARQRARPDLADPAEFKARFGQEPITDRRPAAAPRASPTPSPVGGRAAGVGTP
jgi:carboxyl-terminal processing protease